MQALAGIRDQIELITFDCYGTLIDWEHGIYESLRRVCGLDTQGVAELVEGYIRAEAAIEARGYQSYKKIQSATLAALAASYGFQIPEGKADALSRDLPDWPAFADTNHALTRLKSRYRLGILSNIDRDLLAGTCRQFDVTFDLVITAEDVHSYKPAHPHFLQMLSYVGEDSGKVLHAAQSLYHDAAPAAALGISFAWINRYGQTRPRDAVMLGEFATVAALADALGV